MGRSLQLQPSRTWIRGKCSVMHHSQSAADQQQSNLRERGRGHKSKKFRQMTSGSMCGHRVFRCMRTGCHQGSNSLRRRRSCQCPRGSCSRQGIVREQLFCKSQSILSRWRSCECKAGPDHKVHSECRGNRHCRGIDQCRIHGSLQWRKLARSERRAQRRTQRGRRLRDATSCDLKWAA
jgi:hypothetical protein